MEEEKREGTLAKAEEMAEGLRKEGIERMRAVGKTAQQSVRGFVSGLSKTERFVIIFAIGIVIGYGVKLAARDTVTIGYDDYTLRTSEQSYDLVEMEQRLAEEQMADEGSESGEQGAAVVPAATCQ